MPATAAACLAARKIVDAHVELVHCIGRVDHFGEQRIVPGNDGIHPLFEPDEITQHWVQFVSKCSGLLARQGVGHKMLKIQEYSRRQGDAEL